MKFPYEIQRSIDKHINKEVRKNICRHESNATLYFNRKDNPDEVSKGNYHNAVYRIYQEKENMYAKFEDWENYDKYSELSLMEFRKVVSCSLKIWRSAFR